MLCPKCHRYIDDGKIEKCPFCGALMKGAQQPLSCNSEEKKMLNRPVSSNAYGHGRYSDRPQTVYVNVTNGSAIASFILGLLGLGILSLIFGIVGLRRADDVGGSGRGLAIAGIVFGVIAIFVWFILIISAVIAQ